MQNDERLASSETHLFAGILYCDVCHGKLNSNTSSKYKYYRSKCCHIPLIKSDDFDDILLSIINSKILTAENEAEMARFEQKARIKELEDKRTQNQSKITEINRLLNNIGKIIEDETYFKDKFINLKNEDQRKKDFIQKEIDTINIEIEYERNHPAVISEEFKKIKKGFSSVDTSFDEKRSLILKIIKEIDIDPNGYLFITYQFENCMEKKTKILFNNNKKG